MADGIEAYELVQAKSTTDLETTVNTAIQNGWEPIGGIAAYQVPRGALYDRSEAETHFIQAIIKRSR